MPHFAYFISSHGFGHAARSAAVVEALGEALPGSRFTLLTTVPRWFFEDSLGDGLESVAVADVPPDIGLVQTDALREDLPATLERLRQLLPFSDALVDTAAARLEELGVDLVLTDIAPLGIVAARRAGLPSILVESFTWDFIYRGYLERCPGLGPIADQLAAIYALADHRIQAEPFCVPVDGTERVGPVARRPRVGREATRHRLGLGPDEALVLLTMGGVPWSWDRLATQLEGAGNLRLVVPGGASEERRDGRVIRLPHRSSYHHPDLVVAADAVVGKLGYSTLAEVARAGVPIGYLTRPGFAESAVLERWVETHLSCRRLAATDLESGRWLAAARELVTAPRRPRTADGAREIARRVAHVVRP